ncbi:MAG: hypothetical protein ACYDHY_09690 [Acidiferrobacterales bacterium]
MELMNFLTRRGNPALCGVVETRDAEGRPVIAFTQTTDNILGMIGDLATRVRRDRFPASDPDEIVWLVHYGPMLHPSLPREAQIDAVKLEWDGNSYYAPCWIQGAWFERQRPELAGCIERVLGMVSGSHRRMHS